MNNNELMRYGVLGMKWGKRKNYYGSYGDKYRASNGMTVGAPKNAGVAAFRKVQGTKGGGAVLNGMTKLNSAVYGHGKNKNVWKNIEKQTRKENEAVREANQIHKQAKNEHKQKIESTYKDLNKNSSIGEKLLYNNATRRKAAKFIVDNNMTVEEATKKAKRVSWRNAAAFIAIYGAIGVSSLYKLNN